MKLTGWFNVEEATPVRVGVYEVTSFDNISLWYAYWNGKKFGYRALSPFAAYAEKDQITCKVNNQQWRGLTEPWDN